MLDHAHDEEAATGKTEPQISTSKGSRAATADLYDGELYITKILSSALVAVRMPGTVSREQRRRWGPLTLMVVLCLMAAVVVRGLRIILPQPSTPVPIMPATPQGEQPAPLSALALTIHADGSGNTLLYHTDSEGRLVERIVSGTGDYTTTTASVVRPARTIHPASPLVALSYKFDGLIYKQLFFIDNDYRIMTTYCLSAPRGTPILPTAWTSPFHVYDRQKKVQILPTTMSAFSGWVSTSTTHPQIRLYVGFDTGVVEYRLDLSKRGPRWSHRGIVPSAEAQAGVGVSVWEEENDMTIFARDSGTGKVRSWHYVYLSMWFDNGPNGSRPLGAPIEDGTSVVAVNNGDVRDGIDFVFSQPPDGVLRLWQSKQIVRSVNVKTNDYAIGHAKKGTRLGVVFRDGAADVVYQDVDGRLKVVKVATDGSVLGRWTVV